MTIFAVFSRPAERCGEVLGRDYVRVRFDRDTDGGGSYEDTFCVRFFTQTQCFQQTMTEREAEAFFQSHTGTTFRNVVRRTRTKEITTLTNRHGTVRTLEKPLAALHPALRPLTAKSQADRAKNTLIPQDTPLPFLVRLGVQTADGAIVAQKHAKFRQINRFLEYVDDLLPFLQKQAGGTGFTAERPLRITDFGCGKSYLTFAVYCFLTERRGIPVRMTGLDLKADVIAACGQFARECGYDGLHFETGDIAAFTPDQPSHLVITLHACDTATDGALRHAVAQGTAALLCVPCCQHELNAQLGSRSAPEQSPLATLLQHGILRERFSALATDALRAEYLVQSGYAVQLLEFIDEDLTPKNLLIRATKKSLDNQVAAAAQKRLSDSSRRRSDALLGGLGVTQALFSE